MKKEQNRLYPKIYVKTKAERVSDKLEYLKLRLLELLKKLRKINSVGIFLIQKFHF